MAEPALCTRWNWTQISDRAKRVRVVGLSGPARACYLMALLQDLRCPLLVVTPSDAACHSLYQDLLFFAGTREANLAGEEPPGDTFCVHAFPSWELSPLEPLSPSPEVVGQRLSALAAWAKGEAAVTVASLAALAQRVIPAKRFLAEALTLIPGEALDRDELLRRLSEGGYERVPLVEEKGEYAVRGGIVDIFCPQAALPVRVEFDEEGVESLRHFNVSDQRSVGQAGRVDILPAREFLLGQAARLRGADRLRQWANQRGESDRGKYLADRLIEEGHFPGVENFSPLFFDDLEMPLEGLPGEAIAILDEPHEFAEAEAVRWDALKETAHSPSVEPLPFSLDEYSLPPGRVLETLSRRARPGAPLFELHALGVTAEKERGFQLIRVLSQATGAFQGHVPDFIRQLQAWLAEGFRVSLVAAHQTQAIRFQQILKENDLGAEVTEEGRESLLDGAEEAGLDIRVGRLSEGFILPSLRRVFLREEEVFYTPVRSRPRSAPKRQAFEAAFRDLTPGDYLVHREYGIGLYQGVEGFGLGGREGEFLRVDYAGGDKLYVPMDHLHLVQKYLGAGQGRPRMDRLGGMAWQRLKGRVKASVKSMAQGLLRLTAERQVTPGFAFSPDDHWSQEFAAAFPYEETPDQRQAILDVVEDLERPRPMDRLICGDVGYGKTEVAMRAAFKVVLDKKQVAILVPTTVLAQQHLQTLQERFSAYPVTVELLSRFRSPSEQAGVLKGLEVGSVDIVIGTHRLLQADVRFRDLGLIVVDEEQRFGVTHKEKLKLFRKTADVLTLTATPIPRTLHMGLLGIRDLSVIDTPPADRLAIRTYVTPFSDRVIREALTREMHRGGQIFFVHPWVENIEVVARYLRRLVPGLSLGIAHGKMRERQLEEAMMRFVSGEHRVLLCTTIIENGLDIPNANTILVNRADRYGLAQLYQLRGRVGRGSQQAYAYFLIPPGRVITQSARRRLKALEELGDLGSGFRLAARDLEIRGAGNIIGPEQSGHIAAVGFDLYCQLMEEATQELRGVSAEPRGEPELTLGLVGSLPEAYVPFTNQRLELYREVTRTRTTGELEELRRALADRFGPLPPEAHTLFQVAEIRILASRCRVERVKLEGGQVTFVAAPGEYNLTREFLAFPGLQFVDERTFRLPVGETPEDRFSTLKGALIAFEGCVNVGT